jgi:hypothetical protein
VPLFIEEAVETNPDDDVLIFANYSSHNQLRTIVDKFVGYGMYDFFVKDVQSLAMEHDTMDGLHEAIMEKFNIKDDYSDSNFVEIDTIAPKKASDVLTACAAMDDRINNILLGIRRRAIQPNVEQPKKISKKIAKYDERHHEGKLLIMTACNENYQWYLPLFLRSMQISYPQQKTDIGIIGSLDSEIKSICSENKFLAEITELDYDGHLTGNYESAALRFIINPYSLNFDYYLITDIDILFQPHQHKTIIDQHMMHMLKDGTECYENMITEYRDGNPRMPGIHFVKKEWWTKTSDARDRELNELKAHGARGEYYYDEFMIGRIVVNSGLPLPQNRLKMQWKHGIHLGDWRINMSRKVKVRPDTFQLMHIRTLLDDEVFMNLVDVCSERIPFIKECVRLWPMLFR